MEKMVRKEKTTRRSANESLPGKERFWVRRKKEERKREKKDEKIMLALRRRLSSGGGFGLIKR